MVPTIEQQNRYVSKGGLDKIHVVQIECNFRKKHSALNNNCGLLLFHKLKDSQTDMAFDHRPPEHVYRILGGQSESVECSEVELGGHGPMVQCYRYACRGVPVRHFVNLA